MVLNPVMSKLVGKLVVLASASPRRLEILSNAGLRFEVVPSWFKETLNKRLFKAPHEYAVETAKQKALEVARRMPFQHLKTPDMVIGADTIVTVDGMILEKPVDKDDAYRMLSSLSGKEHSVITGVAIVLCHEKENEEVDYQLIDFYEETKVKFADLSESMLWEYINSGEPMDKAGGYGIQALGGMLVEYVHGDFLNVVGFPLNHFCKQLDLIYNGCSSSSDQLSLKESTSLLPQTSSILPPHSSHSSRSSAKHDPSSSLLHKVKSSDNNSDVEESSWTLVNSLSKHTDDGEVKVRDSENTTVPLMTSRGQVIELNETKHEDRKREKDLQRIMDLMDGFKASKALFTASEMGVFDLLQSSPGLDAAQVAEKIKASVKGTVSLLEACASLGLLKSKERTGQKPVFENTPLAMRFLLSDAPSSLRDHILHCNNSVWPVFTYLESAVREGTNQRERAFGKISKDVFQDTFYSSEEFKLKFMKAMHNIAKVTGKAVATAFDLSSFKTACDIGGCTGAMAHEFTKVHPGLSVMVFDLPTVVEMSQHFHPLYTDNRVSFVPGDFFKDQLPKADLYILARILHDWPDDKVHILLSNIAAVCTPGCAVLIAETLLDGHTPYSALQSLNMIALTDGIERTESRYADLLSNNGFGNMRAVRTGNFLDAFIAFKI